MKAIAGVMAAFSVAVGMSASAAKTNEELVRAVDHAASVALISLEPGESGSWSSEGRCVGYCYFGWPVLGQTIAASAVAGSIRKDLASWIAAPEPESVALCFSPRHGVRIHADNHVYDFVVCFECGQAQVYKDSAVEPVATLYHQGSQTDWNALLATANIPLAARHVPDEDE